MEELRVSLIQTELFWEDASANLQMFTQKIEELDQPTGLIILPEMFSTGFSMNAEKLAENTDGESFSWMCETAISKNIALTGSLIIKENSNYYNRLYFIFPDGSYKFYDKKHLFTLAGEQHTYSSGKEKLIVDYKGFKICPLICYDLRFPVWSRNTEDYDLLIYVANWPAKRTFAWDALLRARSIENMSYVIGVNRIGEDGNGHAYSGHSAVYDMLGKHQSTKNYEAIFSETITLSKTNLQQTREKFGFLRDRDEFTLK
ncbi:amidohydrolase [Mesonia maritima]|uniref:Amidohydrolase n=1 Tax=Mesonia maritima TaxID=1793873 RepID=A0ABU1K1Y2_9FLAO|nr:amidohydrolase [Mesonia maritima]MDR6299611.1 putative amidohydrolase [Mesonia maritima]